MDTAMRCAHATFVAWDVFTLSLMMFVQDV
jgi:hypothetical protein